MKKVLVLCQRKTGLTTKGSSDTVQEKIIPSIQKLIEELLGKRGKKEVAYLSGPYGVPGSVDYVGKLQTGNEFTTAFLNEKHGSYALVILNTCPLQTMDYRVIHALLENRGRMVFAVYPLTYDRGTSRMWRDNPDYSIYEAPEELFTLVSKGDTVVYQKR